jgi:transcriptional regulator with XRE-family HTH domain
MTINAGGDPTTYFGRQMRKERLARGWSLREFSARSGIDFGQASRIENGKQPPTEKVAAKCDAAFPERRGWFAEYYEESRSWVPAAFRSWSEYEDKTASLRTWSPGVLHGLLQTPDYARALLKTAPEVTAEIVDARLRSRMERQRRVLLRDEPPTAWFVVDQLSLYRRVGSPAIMAAQMSHLAEVARRPSITMQILPAVEHPAGASGFIVADSAAYAESVAAGQVFSDEQTVSMLQRLFNSIHSECYRASDSLALVLEVGEIWLTGESPATQTPTAETA